MRGFVAVITHERNVEIDASEADGLAAAYEAVRGKTLRERLTGASFSVVALGEPPDVERHPDGWDVYAGVPYKAPRLEDCEGTFARLSFRDDKSSLVAAVDPFGMQPLYSANRRGRSYLSTSALALARYLQARPDQLGVLEFLRTGYQFGSRTLWEGIERFDPASRAHFDGSRPRNDTYWRPERDASYGSLTIQATAKRCVEESVAACAALVSRDPQPWADLTGGYDTRLLVLLLRAAGIGFRTDTVGEPENEDVVIARRLATKAGWEWANLVLQPEWPDRVETFVHAAIGAADGHLDVLQLAEVLWTHAEKAKVAPTLMNGGGGEHFQFYPWQTEFFRAGRSTDVNWGNWVGIGLMRPVDMSVVRTFSEAAVAADLRERMATFVEPYRDEPNTTQLDLLYAYKVTGHFGAYAAAGQRFMDVELPFYIRRIFSAGHSSNYRYRNGHRLMQRMIEQLDPRLAAIQTAKGGPAQPMRLTTAPRFLPYYGRLGRKAVNKLTHKTLGRALLAPSAPPRPFRAAARHRVAEALGNPRGWRSASLYDANELTRVIGRSARLDFAHAALLGRIVTVEHALRVADSGFS